MERRHLACIMGRRLPACRIQGGIMRHFIVLVFLLIPSTAFAQDAMQKEQRPNIQVSGNATVKVPPDLARISIGIVTHGTTAQEAATQNAQKMDQVVNGLRKLLPRDAQVKTISYSLAPQYVYSQTGGEQRITGYNASNTVQVESADLTGVGKLI